MATAALSVETYPCMYFVTKKREGTGVRTLETMHACTCSLEKCFNYAQKKVFNKRGN